MGSAVPLEALSRVLTWSSFLTGRQSLRWGPSLVTSFDPSYLLRPISVQPQGGWVDIRPAGRSKGRVNPGTRQAQAEPAWASCSPPRGPHSHSVHPPGQGQLSERHTPAVRDLAQCRQQATDHGGRVCEVRSLSFWKNQCKASLSWVSSLPALWTTPGSRARHGASFMPADST